MGCAEELAALPGHVAEVGATVAHLVTVAPDGRPHVVAVRPAWDGAAFVVPVGRHSGANAAAGPAVTLLWAARPEAGYSLIVDGAATVEEGATGARLRIVPGRAVLHRTPDGDPGDPACVTILDAR